jgi:peptide/nickel transport system permease protein
MSHNPLKSYGDRRKQRIDDLAATAATGTVSDAGQVEEAPGVSLIASAWRRLRRDPVFLIGAGITLLFVVLAIVSPWIAPHDPTEGLLLEKVRQQTNPIPGPEPGFPLGADNRGRDLLSRLLVGTTASWHGVSSARTLNMSAYCRGCSSPKRW